MNWLDALQRARRPVLAFGAGVRGAAVEAREFAAAVRAPVVATWGARDLFPDCIGAWGTHGTRAANFAVQNCDWFLSVGARLDTKATGNVQTFAPLARKFMVDIDAAEINKFAQLEMPIRGILSDARVFLRTDYLRGLPDFSPWYALCETWKRRYAYARDRECDIDPYAFIADLSVMLNSDDVIVSDTGCSLAWMMQAFEFCGQRFVHAFNNTPMGYGLPAAIGAAFATGKRVILITGDGGLGANIGELATLAKHALPVKILLFNNRGHAMCRQTQRHWLNGEYHATSHKGGLPNLEFHQIAAAFGIPSCSVKWPDSARRLTQSYLDIASPALVELAINEDYAVEPMVKFGASLEEAEPCLPQGELDRVRSEALSCNEPLVKAA